MYYTNAKEYLQSIKYMKNKITDQVEYIQRLRDSLGIAGIRYDKDKVQSSFDQDKFGSIFAKIDEEEICLSEMQERLVKREVEILNEIHQLSDDKHKKVLNLYYVDCKNLKKCANIMNFSYDYVKELHLAAVDAFQNQFAEKFPPQSA